ncbi:trimeric autotransporter adhesin Ata [Acinetobacter dispersus]|uniref:trimeric autotransporter adhesin Ata n=1 Tax=Acinetobacter dispersus TaxID=70348 RepID=UPI001F4AD809|nr:trimeric autotransporter adhesin Ata [Acinetobacter dispersus]MCH7382398.1 trimeric autotransporter adhesin Ata [Acinetobacter dispersus]
MNKVYKVVWNASIGAWVATSELAKSKTKTKSNVLNLSAAILVGAISFSPAAFAAQNIGGGGGSGTSISGTATRDQCSEGVANTSGTRDIAIGCAAKTQGTGSSNIANRQNPYNNSTGAFAGNMKQGGAISLGVGATTEQNFGTAIGSYATTTDIAGIAIGTAALSKGNTALAIGRQSAATADYAQALGNVAAATGKGSLAIGHSATAEGYRAIAIGSPDIENAGSVAGQAGAEYQSKMATKATGKDSIAFGGGAVATQENSLAIGAFSESTGAKSVAIGTGAKAKKDNAVVIGDQAETTFDGGVAVGKGARSEAENSIALGKDSKATQATGESFLTKKAAPTGVLSVGDVGAERRIQNVADGAVDSDAATVGQLKAARTHYVSVNDNGVQGGNYENDGAKGRNSIAVGVNTTSTGSESVAVGSNARSTGTGAVSVGSASETVGSGDVAIGRNASTKGAAGTATSYSNQSIAIGDQTKAIGDQSIAIGADVIARGNSSVAIGGDDVDKIAQDAELSKTYTDITGGVLKAGRYPTTEANHGSTAVGTQAVGTGAFSSAFGMTSKATGDASSAFGVMSNAAGKGASAFGAVAQATGDGASAMGINSLASGTNSTAIGSGNKPGEGATATGNGAAAIGSNAKATGDNAAAVGKGAEATNENAAAIGGGAKATGKNSAAIGGGALADQENAVAVGQGAQSMVVGGVALGARSRVEAENSVALGQDAVATEATGSSFLTNRDASMSNGVVSVGSAGKERRITNVEDGSADSDAVTVRQLKNVDSRVNENAQNISNNAQNITNLNQKLDDTKTDLGNQITDTNNKLDDAKKDLGNQITDTKTELNNTINNTKTELNTKIDNTKTELENKGLNFAGNTGKDVHRKLGDKLNIIGGADANTAEDKTSGENVITRTTEDGIKIELLKDAKFDSITTGDTVVNNNGLTIKDGPSITKDGINAGNKVISNVADGKDGKDAVNLDQLTNVKDGLDGKITDTNNKLDDAKKDLGNQITDTKTELNNTINNTKTELNTKIDNTKTELENKGLNFAGNAGGDVHRKLGEKLNIVGGADANTAEDKTSGENVITRTTADGIKIELLKDAKFDSITTGDTVLNNNGLTIKDGPSITKDGINAGNKVISNVADGKDGKDAVNVDQLTNVKDGLDGKITDTNNKLDDAKKDLGNQITDTKDQLTTQITDTKTELNNTINNTKTELNNTIDKTKTDLENKGLNFAGNAGKDVHRKLGDKLNIVGGADAATAEDKTSGENVITRTTEDGIKIELLKDAKFDSITTGDTVVNNNGLTIKDGPSITKDGINAGNKVITNVADGSIANGSKDAVNGGQIQNISESIKNSIGGNTTVNPDGSITTNNIGGTGKNNINDAISNVKDAATKAKTTVTEGDNIVVKETTNKDGSTNYEVSTKKDLTLDSVTTGDTVLNNNGLTIKDGPSITKDGINAGNKVITNVADGSIAKDSKDAVNGGQIQNISESIKNSIGGNTTVNPDGSITTNNIGGTGKDNINDAIKSVDDKVTNGVNDLTNKGLNFAGNAGKDVHRKLGDKLNIVGGADAATAEEKTSGENVITRTTEDGIKIELLKDAKFDSIATGDSVLNNNGLTIKDGPSITKDGINAGNKTITNVADGVNGKDAVNVDQLTNVKDGLDGKITDTNNKLDDAKKDLGNQITNTKDQLTNQITDTKTELNNTIDKTKTDLENKGLNFAGNAGKDVHRKLGDKLNIVGGADAATAEDKTSGENVITRTTEDGIKIELLKDAKFDSITTGDTVVNNNGLTIKDGPSITKDGINAGNKVITNVADGSIANGSKDAVNGGQIQNISESIKNSIGGNTTVNPDGTITTNNIGGTGKDNINDAIKSVDDKVTTGVNDLTNKGLNFAGNAGKDVHRKLGDKLNIVGGADANTAEDKTSGENVITRTTEDGIKIELLKDAKFDSITTGDTVVNNNGLTIKDGPSITKDGINAGNKVITNVADGSIANGSKDAVNGGQIQNISESIKNSIGGNTTVNPDGSIVTNNIGGTGKNNINDAISNVKDAATKAKTTVTEGDNIVVKETTNKDGSTNYEVSTKKDLTLDSITTGDTVVNNNGLTIKDGPSITKDGINAGNKVITNVADGSIANGSKDAVNGGQIQNISESIKNSIGGNTTVNPDGSITTNNIGGTGKDNINDAIKSVDDKVTTGVNDLTNKGLNFAGNAGKDVHRKLGDKLNIVGGADAETAEEKTSGENVITRTTEDGIKIELLKDAKFDSITTGDTVLNNNGLVIKNGPSITKDGINAGNKTISNVADGVNGKDAVNVDQLNKLKDQIGKDIGNLSDNAVQYDKDKDGNVDKNSVTLGGGDKGTNIKNVADGKVEQGSKDAVNGGQLWDVKQNVDKNTNDIQNIQNNIQNINDGKTGLVQQQKPNGEITVGKDTGGNSINMAGKDGDRVIKGVDNGTIAKDSKEAVNGGQIHNISDSIKNSIGGNTTVNSDGTIKTNNIGGTGKDTVHDAIGALNQSNQELGNRITNLGDQLQQAFYDTNQRIDNVEKKANAGIAAAMALEAAPFVAGKYTYAAGAAYHGGENAVGVTLRKTSDNGRWSITGGVAAASQGDPSVRIGISGVIN